MTDKPYPDAHSVPVPPLPKSSLLRPSVLRLLILAPISAILDYAGTVTCRIAPHPQVALS